MKEHLPKYMNPKLYYLIIQIPLSMLTPHHIITNQ